MTSNNIHNNINAFQALGKLSELMEEWAPLIGVIAVFSLIKEAIEKDKKRTPGKLDKLKERLK